MFPVKRAVLYTCHNWSWQNNKLAQRINCELLTDPSRSSRRHHVYFEVKYGFDLSGKVGIPSRLPLKQTNEVTLTCGPRRELLRTSLGPLVDICRPGRTCLSYQECGLRPIFCLFKRTSHLHFLSHCTVHVFVRILSTPATPLWLKKDNLKTNFALFYAYIFVIFYGAIGKGSLLSAF